MSTLAVLRLLWSCSLQFDVIVYQILILPNVVPNTGVVNTYHLLSATKLIMTDSQDSLEQHRRAEKRRIEEERHKEEEHRRFELRRKEEQVQKYAAECRRQEEKAAKELEAAQRHAAEARRGAEWAQAGAVVAVAAAAARAFYKK
ncbi:polar residue-rich protein 2 [Diadegma semiclausum ichnovirus]|nr:polar residue-rich protein 2 [Diadegma semiclausum ichnovirus]